MPAIIERQTTVTRTVQGADQLRQNLTLIAQEVQRVRDQAQSEVGTMERIRQMLDAGYLNDLLATVTQLQERIRSLETGSMDSTGEAGRLRTQLKDEQTRLQKLWDAYKVQEDELARVKRDYPLLEEKLFERERTTESLRREVARLEPFARFKSVAEQTERENNDLRREAERLRGELQRVEEKARGAEREMVALRETGVSAERVRELESSLEEERERLAKLYKVYEDLESAKKELERRLKTWEEWFQRLQPAMQQMCSSAGGPAGT